MLFRSVIAEELGFAGVLVVLAGFAFVTLRAFTIGRKAALADRPFAALVAYGIGAWIGVQAFIILAGVMRVLPLTGVTLPYMSYGGSSLVANYVLLALLISVSHSSARRLHEVER